MPLNNGGPGTKVTCVDNEDYGGWWSPITITATSKPLVPDATKTFDLSTMSRFVTFYDVIAALWVAITSFGGGGNTLNYAIEINGIEIKTGTLSTGGSTGGKGVAYEIARATLTIPEDYVMDVFLWVNAGSCVLASSIFYAGPGCLAASGYVQTVLTPIPGTVVIDASGKGYTAAQLGADELEMQIYYYDWITTWQVQIWENVGVAGAGQVDYPPYTGSPTILPPPNAALPMHKSIFIDLWNNDGPACLVYMVFLSLLILEDT